MTGKEVHDNLDAISQRLLEAERVLDEVIHDDHVTYRPDIPSDHGVSTFDELTQFHQQLRITAGWGPTQLEAALTPELHAQLQQIRSHERLSWEVNDYATVGLASLIGAFAALFDDQLSRAVGQGLAWLRGTDMVRGWEAGGHGLPIDYQGDKFGGPSHRVRSAGHDIGRPFAALRQIRSGAFEGFYFQDGIKHVVTSTTNQFGTPYQPVPGLFDAIVVLLQHLGSDLVTPMGLPLPGWTKLAELPSRPIREFVNKTYAGQWAGHTSGPGLNSTWAMSQTLPVLAIEIILRTNAHLAAYTHRGELRLTPAEKAKLRETLLVAYSLNVAVCASKAVIIGMVGEGPLAIRHLNLATMIRAGSCTAQVFADRRKRAALAPPTWTELLHEQVEVQLRTDPDLERRLVAVLSE
jgi:hypothetical protein